MSSFWCSYSLIRYRGHSFNELHSTPSNLNTKLGDAEANNADNSPASQSKSINRKPLQPQKNSTIKEKKDKLKPTIPINISSHQ